MKSILFSLIICILTIIAISNSCKKEDEILIPTIVTSSISNITESSASCGGNITDDGGLTVIARGVCWSTDINPTISGNKTNDGGGAGSFASYITELSEETTYYIRAYATNSAGTGYGMALSFTTKKLHLPVITTSAISDTTSTTARCGGNITSAGGSPIISRGICWSTDIKPTLEDSITKDGSDVGSFTSTLISLNPNTTYFVRAYATNSDGTGYGMEISFKTLSKNAFKERLTSNAWVLIADTVDPGIDFGGGIIITDMYSMYSQCYKDNLSNYTTTGNYTIEEGPTKCDSKDPQVLDSGTWTFNSDETILILTNSSLKVKNLTIEELSYSKLIVSYQQTYDAIKYKITSTYQVK